MFGSARLSRRIPGPCRHARALVLCAGIVATPAAVNDAFAAGDCSFFEGKTVELVVPFAAGGGFDVYGRMVAKVMGEELGASTMIVRNQPGAGGLLAANQTAAGKPDGLRIQLISVSGMIAAELGGAEGVNFKTNAFSWIGRISGEPDVVSATPGRSISTPEAVKAIGGERELRIGSTGIGSPQYVSAMLLAEVLDTPTKVITGFSGTGEVFASLQRAELDLFAASLSTALSAEKAETGRIVWLLGNETVPDRPDIKPLSTLIDAKYLPLLKVHADAIAAGRALAGPPNLPEDRLNCLRAAFDRTMASDKLLAESKALNRPVEPLSGPAVAELVESATDGAPREYLELLRKSFAR